MLEVRQPVIRAETSHLDVRSAGLEWLIDFDKSYYIGQQAVDAQREEQVERRLVGFVARKDAAVEPEDKVVLGEREIGTVVVAHYSAALNATLGLALNTEPFTVPGLTWAVKNKQGKSVEARSISSPYIVPKSWTVKML